jgi:hypothetical protein
MLRFKLLASAIPLIVAAAFAREGLLPGPGPCIAIGQASLQLTSARSEAQFHVSFTDDPARATVRVQIADDAAAADFAVVDDVDSADNGSCEINALTQRVAISTVAAGAAPVIYLTRDAPADYKIFVRSKRFSAREAAALVVGANAAPAASHLALNF